MKKLLLILSFLASQLLAIECTEQQYKPYFSENSDRYIYCGNSIFGKQVFDKNSIIYDKEKQTIKVWVIGQSLGNYFEGIMKEYNEFDIKNNMHRFISTANYKCNGQPLASNPSKEWRPIIPGSMAESTLIYVKEYLKIK